MPVPPWLSSLSTCSRACLARSSVFVRILPLPKKNDIAVACIDGFARGRASVPLSSAHGLWWGVLSEASKADWPTRRCRQFVCWPRRSIVWVVVVGSLAGLAGQQKVETQHEPSGRQHSERERIRCGPKCAWGVPAPSQVAAPNYADVRGNARREGGAAMVLGL